MTLIWLSQLNLQAGYWDIFWPQLIQGVGMSLLFVPLTTVAMDPIPREKMGNATSLFNLMRNIGGSVGIAMTGTMLARHQQATTAMLGANVTPTTRRRSRCSRRCARRSWPPAPTSTTATDRAYAALFGMVQRQASMVSFVGIFQLLGVLFLALIPLVLLMKRPKRGGPSRQRTDARDADALRLTPVARVNRPVLADGVLAAASRAARCARSPDRRPRSAARSARRSTPASSAPTANARMTATFDSSQPIAVGPRRDQVVLDQVIRDVEHRRRSARSLGDTVSASTIAEHADMMKPSTGTKSTDAGEQRQQQHSDAVFARLKPRAIRAKARAQRAKDGSAPCRCRSRLSHSDRILFGAAGATKLDLARYYDSIADWILPHVVDRPLTLVRCPNGVRETGQ